MVSAQKSATKPAQAKPVKATPPAADLEYEQQLFASGARTVAGIDEVGRGSMAGPVTVGVAILTPDATLEVGGLIDSKPRIHGSRNPPVVRRGGRARGTGRH